MRTGQRALPSLDEVIAETILVMEEAHSSGRVRQTGGGYTTVNSNSEWSCRLVAIRLVADCGTWRNEDVDRLLPLAGEAAWSLVRRGLLRPGVTTMQDYIARHDPTLFALTEAGRAWLGQPVEDRPITLQPGALSQTLQEYRPFFGPGYLQRANEAIRCGEAAANLACCAMCGAAAESILLALCIAREGSEEPVLKEYRRSSGRSSVMKTLLGQARSDLRERFEQRMGLLSDWRDESAHGVASSVSGAHAQRALDALYRLAKLSADHWQELTGRPKP